MSEETTTTNQDTQQPEPSQTPGENGGQTGGKMFTQDEVNHIVAERLAREKAKGQPSELDQKLADANDRIAAAEAKERKIDCEDWLSKERLPAGLSRFLDTSSIAGFKDSARDLTCCFEKAGWTVPSGFGHAEHQTADSALRAVFGLKKGK